MQCACAILSSAACPAVLYFSTSSRKRHDFREKTFFGIKRMFFPLQLLSGTLLVLRIIERDRVENVYRSSHEVPLLLCEILMKPEFFAQIFEKKNITC